MNFKRSVKRNKEIPFNFVKSPREEDRSPQDAWKRISEVKTTPWDWTSSEHPRQDFIPVTRPVHFANPKGSDFDSVMEARKVAAVTKVFTMPNLPTI